MSSIKTEQNTQKNRAPLFLDCLYCEEKYWDDYNEENDSISPSKIESFEDDMLFALLSKEGTTHFNEGDLEAYYSLMEERREALNWMMKVNVHHEFSSVTLVLSVYYFDKVIMEFGYQKDRPWMTQLAAVACLSLASKIEETHVPLLLELQVENKYTFDAKTIQRMELLVLSTLEWKMYAVTPLSFFEHLLTRLKLKDHLHWDILYRCQSLILSVIVDPRFLCYAPSVLAVATMLLALRELGLGDKLELQIDIINTFKLNKEKVEECRNFIRESSTKANNKAHKRKYSNIAAYSPKNVLDAEFCDGSSDPILFSGPPSPEPVYKRCR